MSKDQELEDGGLAVYDNESLLGAVAAVSSLVALRTQATTDVVKNALGVVTRQLSIAICEYVSEIAAEQPDSHG